MKRTTLVNFRSLALTPDTASALRKLDEKAAELGVRINFEKAEGLLPEKVHLYLLPAGRSVRLRIAPAPESEQEWTEEQALAAAWGLMIPLGFTPYRRYPLPGEDDNLFHFLGPWHPIMDRMFAEGRGHLAWSSLCAAAQADVGTWNGNRKIERFVQAQLHRVGANCGAVDGIIGERTQEAIQALGLGHLNLQELASHLMKMEVPQPKVRRRRTGRLIMPGFSLSVSSFGKVHTSRNHQGALFVVDGPGRIVIDVRDEDE